MPRQSFWKKEIKFNAIGVIISVAAVFVISGLATGLFINYVFPQLSGIPGFRGLAPRFPIVVNKTQEVRVVEGINTNQVYERIRSVTVAVVSHTTALNPADKKYKPPVIGSGVIATSDGLVLTTKEVVGAPNSKIEVITSSGESFSATLQAQDSKSELVMIKIPAQNLPVAQFEDSSTLQMGDKMVAVGPTLNKLDNPVMVLDLVRLPGLSAVYPRVVSSEETAERLVGSPELKSDFFGSALANRDGRVVGVMGEAGIIPGEYVRSLLDNFLASKQLTHAALGVQYTLLTPALSKLMGFTGGYGALLLPRSGKPAVTPGAAAATAGLREGDFIYKINSSELTTQNTLEKMMDSFRAGEEITIGVIRGGQQIAVKAKLKIF